MRVNPTEVNRFEPNKNGYLRGGVARERDRTVLARAPPCAANLHPTPQRQPGSSHIRCKSKNKISGLAQSIPSAV